MPMWLSRPDFGYQRAFPPFALIPCAFISRCFSAQVSLASPTSSPMSLLTSLDRPGPTSGSRSLLPPEARLSVLALLCSWPPALEDRSSIFFLRKDFAGLEKKAMETPTPTTA